MSDWTQQLENVASYLEEATRIAKAAGWDNPHVVGALTIALAIEVNGDYIVETIDELSDSLTDQIEKIAGEDPPEEDC